MGPTGARYAGEPLAGVESVADLNQREWQARTAKFILGAANRPPALARAAHDGHAFMSLGLSPSSGPVQRWWIAPPPAPGWPATSAPRDRGTELPSRLRSAAESRVPRAVRHVRSSAHLR